MNTTAKHQRYCTCPDRDVVECAPVRDNRSGIPASDSSHLHTAYQEAIANGSHETADALLRIINGR